MNDGNLFDFNRRYQMTKHSRRCQALKISKDAKSRNHFIFREQELIYNF